MSAGAKGLEAYRAKRDFSLTREPTGQERGRDGGQEGGKTSRAKKLSFVVQKHAARRLHYDFRLELDGVLKSWAIAKGPSLIPGEKRLAVHVEDHPLDYGGFEGAIPEGQYGAGSVIVWDRGVWRPDGDPNAAYATGRLHFSLEGEKLKGAWTLVRMRSKKEQRGDNWLLIKSDDSSARTPDDPDILEEEPRSALSGATIEKVAKDPSARRWTRGKPAAAPDLSGARPTPRQRARAPMPSPDGEAAASTPNQKARKRAAKRLAIALPKSARRAKMTGFIEPCLATAASAPPLGEKWVHELKFDGYRLQAALEKGKAAIRTRRGLDWSEKFPTIVEAVGALPIDAAVFDGEAVVEDANGVADFASLQEALKAGRTEAIVYYIFDLLYFDGFDLRASLLAERKDLLERVLEAAPQDGALRYSAHFAAAGLDVLRQVCRLGGEGVVSKRIDRPYVSGRASDWLKAKCADRQEFVVIGFAPSTTEPKAIGSLVLGYYEDGKLMHAGRAGTGYSLRTAKDLFAQLDKIKRESPPVDGPLPAQAKRNVRWTAPALVAEIEFRGWTGANMARQAAFKGLRDDKAPTEIVREAAVAAQKSETSARRMRPTSVKLTHADRLLWPEAGFSKEALAEYYGLAWPWIAPHILGRPLALVRCPNGVDQSCFFQKHAWEGAGTHLALVEDPGEAKPLVSIDDFDGLMALVQASVLEIHPWGATAARLETPDRLVFDLDPGEGIGWGDLAAAARDVRARLQADKIESFVKTSGGKGLHVVAPIAPRHGWDEAKSYCRAIAQAMAADSPDRLTATMAKRERTGRIFIDYLRNGRGSTAVAAYSTRARPSAGISTPLAWDELDAAMKADRFTLANIGRRLASLDPDPWKGMDAARQGLPAGKVRSKRAAK
jgi:bifunctional non-homologous end joining protein LigD